MLREPGCHSAFKGECLPTKFRLCFLLVAAIAVDYCVLSSQGQSSKPSEYEVKAAYLYNFGKFVEWPSRAATPRTNSFNICLVGQDPFGTAINATLSDETIAGKRVAVRRIQVAPDAIGCQILFISASEEHQLKQTLAALEGLNVLTVSDMPEFSRRGGMVQFVLEGSKVRFEINLAAAEHAGLALSSELLKLAVNVRKGPTVGD